MAVNRGRLDREVGREVVDRGASSAFDPFLGRSTVLADFLGALRLAAESDATVLLSGESGVGKSRAAERLHRWSRRSSGPFVSASLVAASPTLIEATLFGHERGAFTDAHRGRTGLFRRADQGTLLLDEVDHLPLDIQVKLLRVLQERVVEPLGGEAPVPVDVRVVATSATRLERAVQEGRFRADLYYRLAVLELEVPSLRLRADDLVPLAEELIPIVAERIGVPPRLLSPGALERLRTHTWPGNVRELENALERVLVLGPRGEGAPRPIEPGELEFLAQGRTGAVEDLARAALSLGVTVDEVSRAMMECALREQRGNVSAAARAVGLTRRAFDYRMLHEPGEARQE